MKKRRAYICAICLAGVLLITAVLALIVFKGGTAKKEKQAVKKDKSKEIVNKSPAPEETYLVPEGFDEKLDNVNYGEIKMVTYPSATTGSDRKANILLPANYSSEKKYPVLYLLHGIGGDHDEWLGGTPQYIIGNLVAQGMAKEMIVVMPNVRARADDSVPSDYLSLENFKAFDNFINDLKDDLMPFIKEHYSIKEGRENTAIAGLSMGGREALYIGIRMADTFGYTGAFSPAVGVLPYSGYISESGLFSKKTFKLPERYNENTLLLICNGDNDTVVYDTPKQYHDTLTENGTKHIYYETEGGHDFGVWENGLYNFVRRIF